MKVLLLKDVYKLGRAGEVHQVKAGYGRNYLIPQGMAMMATAGALKQADRIKDAAAEERARLNTELEAVYERLHGLQLNFPVRAGETGKLYGSVTTQMISDAIGKATGVEVEKQHIDSEPIKTLGVHTVAARLTVDLIPELTVVVHEEDLPPESAFEVEEPEELPEAEGAFSDLQAELEAEEAEAEMAEQAEAEPAELDTDSLSPSQEIERLLEQEGVEIEPPEADSEAEADTD